VIEGRCGRAPRDDPLAPAAGFPLQLARPGASWPHLSGNNDHWILDLRRQKLEAEGTIDAKGEAIVTVSIPDDASLAGTFRGFQATIPRDGAGAGGATVGFTMAHGRRVR
jgi:hypothetical protein